MTEAQSNDPRTPARLGFRFSLRLWFILLTLICIGVVIGVRVQQRLELEKTIVASGTIYYHDLSRSDEAMQTLSTSLGPIVRGAQPHVRLRDASIPWISRASGGSVAFSAFDSISYSVSNVPMPVWTNDVLATGELRSATLRLNNADVDANLLMKSTGMEELTLSGRADDPDVLVGVHRLKRLKSLAVLGVDGLKFERLVEHGLPSGLEEVTITACGLQPSDVAMLRTCRQLQRLNLRSCAINLQGLSEFGLPETLTELDLSNTSVVKGDLELLADCPRLQQLRMSASTLDLRELAGDTPAPPELRGLAIRRARLDASTFRWLARFPRLETLTLAGCSFDDSACEGIRLSRSLREVTASSTNAGPYFAAMLAASSNRFTSLDLAETAFDDAALTVLGPQPDLTTVRLREAKISDGAGVWLSQLSSLKKLEMNGTDVSDALLDQLPQLAQLEYLGVAETQVSERRQDMVRKRNEQHWRQARGRRR